MLRLSFRLRVWLLLVEARYLVGTPPPGPELVKLRRPVDRLTGQVPALAQRALISPRLLAPATCAPGHIGQCHQRAYAVSEALFA